MAINSLHLLLTYTCNFGCDHCFLFGSPDAEGVMRIQDVRRVLKDGKEAGVKSIFVEGGEPFLYYPILIWTLRKAKEMGMVTGIVTNCYWATSVEDAKEWLKPVPELDLADISLSEDYFHYEEGKNPKFAREAAKELGIPHSTITIEDPRSEDAPPGANIMLKGRAAVTVAPDLPRSPWRDYTKCDHETFENQGRVHVDPFGFVHVCQGICIGNMFEKSLKSIFDEFQPREHPITGPLLEGGPAKLAETYGVEHKKDYADQCEFCFDVRLKLREKFPGILCPDQMYGAND
jgi:MoaA/NifB/PqqE/SkfB family radical SAM enzyme